MKRPEELIEDYTIIAEMRAQEVIKKKLGDYNEASHRGYLDLIVRGATDPLLAKAWRHICRIQCMQEMEEYFQDGQWAEVEILIEREERAFYAIWRSFG